MPLVLRALLSVVLRAWQARLSEVVTLTSEECGHGWLIMVLMYIHRFNNRAAVQGEDVRVDEDVRVEQVFVQAFPAVQDDPMFEPETPEVQVGVPRLARVQQHTVGSGESWRPFKCCSNLLLHGVCQHGYNCTFAHSSAELHPRAPPTQHMMMEAFERGW